MPRPHTRALCVLGLLLLASVRANAIACVGDCNGDGVVSVSELVVGVNILLGMTPLSACGSFDANGDGSVTVGELVAATNALLNNCVPVPVPVFPANYRDSYTEVRDCRLSVEHGEVYIRVLANPISAQPYQDNADPLPVGSIVVKEEFNNPGCHDGDLVRWRVMRKQSPGFDPTAGDWHWQWVNADRSVQFDDKSTCIGCHSRPACLARDYMCTQNGTPPPGSLQMILSQQPPALLSVSGTSAADVYTVGADPGDGFGPYVLHYDGTRWHRLNTHATGDLWWISVTPVDGAFYMAGAGGLVLRYDPTTATFERQSTPSAVPTMFGVWGSSTNNVWAVGGDPADDDHGGVVWHYNGATWNVDLAAPKVMPGGLPTLFKVWGRSDSDMYAVGRLGVILHFDGINWTLLDSGTTDSLFTVHGTDTLLAAAGGDVNGDVLEPSGGGFVNRLAAAPQMNGVFIPPNGNGVAVGIGGALALRGDTGWTLQNTTLSTALDFHAVWVDPDGGIWAVGGDLGLLRQGMLAYGGTQIVGGEVVPLAPCPPSSPVPGMTYTVSYSHDVKPLLDGGGCTGIGCHGAGLPSSNYDLSTYETSFGPGTEAKVLHACDIVPGDPDTSYLIEKLAAMPRIGAQMPSNRPPLADQDIATLRTWILEGAVDDSAPTATAPPTPTPTNTPPPGQATATPVVTPVAGTPTPNPLCAHAGVICTVAGTGRSEFNGDGKPALQTSLYFPLEVIFDPNGLPLILDFNNLRIRRIDADGTVETIMGTDYEDFPTNGALAKDTPLHHPSDIAYDTQGQLYVAGDHVPVVFRVGTDDRVLIVAGTTDIGNDGDGGPALQAKLTTPFGVLPTADGGLYISDIDAHVIRFVDSGGIIHTIAGTGVSGYAGDNGPATSALLGSPTRMQRDGAGNLYFCDTLNNVIRKIDTAGTITTIAGNGHAGYAGDNGPATQAQLTTPYGLRFAPNGDLYIADTGNNVIRRVDGSGMITSVVGSGDKGFGGDGSAAGTCQLDMPYDIDFAADGSMWIADTRNQRIRRVAGFLPPQ